MAVSGDKIKELRKKAGLTQQQLSEMLCVDRSSLSSWETNRRQPDTAMVEVLAKCLKTDITELIGSNNKEIENIIIVDDMPFAVKNSIATIKSVFRDAEVKGFTAVNEAIEYAKENEVQLAFLDIEFEKSNGLDLCRDLLEINPKTNIVFLTAYKEYAFDAWQTGAIGFLMKPLTVESIEGIIKKVKS
jgi:transcriptional regulator with XRE-family HTH domain